MTGDPDLIAHYGRDGGAYEAIVDALADTGVDLDGTVPAAALSGADEFHLGGAVATAAIIDALGLGAGDHVLDLGCGVGGPARSMVAATGCRVTGVDLTPTFVEAAERLSHLTGLGEATRFRVGDVGRLDDADATYDAATMFHVGMNLPDKPSVFTEVERVLGPGGRFVVYDVMRVAAGELDYPVPWSSTPATSHLATPEEYADALRSAGFAVAEPIDRRELVAEVLARAAANPPPVNLVHLMGPEFPSMIANLVTAFRAGVVSPVQIVATA
ncbi:MAG: methyltransferase domain-containing protein [Actinomycetota bacterium]